MQHTNEFLARVWSAYMPCEVLEETSDIDNRHKVVGISHYDGNFQVDRGNYDDWWNIAPSLKLLLTPLSKISDEHLTGISRIILSKESDWMPIAIERNENYINAVVNVEPDITDKETEVYMFIRVWSDRHRISWVWEYKKGNSTGIDDRRVPNISHAIDFLRSHGYDCGYMQIDSLIAAGLAIDASSSKDERSVANQVQ